MKKLDELSPEEKMEIFSRMPEIQTAVKLLIGLMENIGAENYVKIDFVIDSPLGQLGDTFTLTFSCKKREGNVSNELPSA